MTQKKPFITLAQAKEIAADIPTPFHLYDEKGIRENARKMPSSTPRVDVVNRSIKECLGRTINTTLTIVGFKSGMMIEKKILVLEQPSIRADSSSSTGSPLTALCIIKNAKARPIPQ